MRGRAGAIGRRGLRPKLGMTRSRRLAALQNPVPRLSTLLRSGPKLRMHRSVQTLFASVLACTVATGCGSAVTPASDALPAQGDGDGSAASDGEGAPVTGAAKRLQGTWEITRFESADAMPPEAMALMSELFDNLRLRFSGKTAIVALGDKAPERKAFDVENEDGDRFKLVMAGGIFHGASCRFVDDSAFEVDDTQASWPGKSLLKRAK